MSVPDERNDPAGTVYGARRAARSALPRDPLMRIALATALVGVLLGLLFATGVLGGGDEPVVPATASAAPTSAAASPTAAPTASEPAPTTPAAPSPTPPPTTPPAPVAGPTVVRAATSGLCVGVDGDGEKATAQLADCTGGPEQQWVVNPVGPDVVTLANAAYGQCLDVEGESGDDGAKLQQYPCHGRANQQWRLAPTGAGPVLLVAVHSGKCAQVDDAGAKAGDDLEQVPCTGAPEQQWAVG